MRRYKSNSELKSVICNCCGKKMIVEEGILREGVMAINHVWDFFSEKDGEIHHWDLCEECYDSFTDQFIVDIEVEEQVEFV